MSWFAFKDLQLLIDPVYPWVVLSLVYLVASLLGYLRTEARQRQIRRTFSQYMSPHYVEELARHPERLKLGGQTRSMTRDNEYHRNSARAGWFAPAPDEDYSRNVEIEQTRRALDKLKEPMRSCLLLRHQGLSYREIADTLSVKETNVGSLVARGRKEFARVYGKIGGK